MAARRGRAEPGFGAGETDATYAAAARLVERGLAQGVHVVHDATNLDEARRRPAFRAAERAGAPAAVVFVEAPETVRERRAREAGPRARRAHAALGRAAPDPAACPRPSAVLDGTREPASLVRELAEDPPLAGLDLQP